MKRQTIRRKWNETGRIFLEALKIKINFSSLSTLTTPLLTQFYIFPDHLVWFYFFETFPLFFLYFQQIKRLTAWYFRLQKSRISNIFYFISCYNGLCIFLFNFLLSSTHFEKFNLIDCKILFP